MRSKNYKLAALGLALALGCAPASNVRAQIPSVATPVAAASPKASVTQPGFEIGREEIRRSLMEYFGWGVTYPEVRVQPQMEVLEKIEENDHFRWHVRYEVEPDEQSYAYLLIPKPFPAAGTRLPLVLCPHPTALTGKDRTIGKYPDSPPDAAEASKRLARQYALDLVRQGFIAFAPDRAAYGQRRLTQDTDVRKQMAAYQKDLSKRRPGWRLTAGKNVWDLQRALDFLTKLEFVDADRIGTIGHSLGAWDSLMILAMDDRVKTAVVNSGGTLRFQPELWQNEQALRAYLGDPKKQQLNANANLMFMLAAGRSMLYIWSTEDAYDRGGPNLVEGFRVIKNAFKTNFKKAGKTDLSHYLHSRGHDFPPEAHALAYTWFKEKLITQSSAPATVAEEEETEATPVTATIDFASATIDFASATPTAPAAPKPPAPPTATPAPAAPEEPLRPLEGVKKENLHLYLLVGQSNMAGRGVVSDIDRETHPRVFSLGRDDQWIPAQEPLHWDIKNRGIGPGLAFGKAMAEAHPNATIGLVPAAVGGTLIEWWLPGAERRLFENAVARAKRAQQTGTLKGILWQQGESDSYGERTSHYRERLTTLIKAFRRELGDDNIPIVIGGLGDFLKPAGAKKVEEALRTVATETPKAAFAPASAKGHIGDQLHFNAEAARENGEIMARAMLSLETKQP